MKILYVCPRCNEAVEEFCGDCTCCCNCCQEISCEGSVTVPASVTEELIEDEIIPD